MQEHWEQVYRTKAPDRVSWFRPHLETSLRLIERAAGGNNAAAIIDVGGGASTLADDLLDRGYGRVTVLDISEAALEAARIRLGTRAEKVRWMRADVTRADLPSQAFDVWHDRAVFHFLTKEEDRAAYVRSAAASVKPGGHVIVSAFGPEGPVKCSGLDVVRYDAASLHDQFGPAFYLLDHIEEVHETPFGTTQQFVYCYCAVEDLNTF